MSGRNIQHNPSVGDGIQAFIDYFDRAESVFIFANIVN